jgi:hypothetical protein
MLKIKTMEVQSYLFIAILVIVILVIIFLILRELNCWYWKINERLEQQRRTNFLLEKIYFQNGGKLPDLKGDEKEEKLSTEELDANLEGNEKEEKFSTEGLNDGFYNQLSAGEKAEINELVRFGIKKGIKIAINKTSRKIEKLDEKNWEIIKKVGTSENWIIIIEKSL